MNANEAKSLTDKNFENERNKLLKDILNSIKNHCKSGLYSCDYRFKDKISYMDYNYIMTQLESLGYIAERIEKPIRRGSKTRPITFSIEKFENMRTEIRIFWGN
ncbi:hypothetical protein [Lysinibacillus sp. NPDC086135]|uniref:hypothetical protein n=1 Tax=Lysinibacillus sp. NPDC086135 TaxID=3364130 RepID=UPI00381EEF27